MESDTLEADLREWTPAVAEGAFEWLTDKVLLSGLRKNTYFICESNRCILPTFTLSLKVFQSNVKPYRQHSSKFSKMAADLFVRWNYEK